MDILLCSNGTYYTGSTVDLWRRMNEHWTGKGANQSFRHRNITLIIWHHWKFFVLPIFLRFQ
ncbi:MAG: GIY-YIG nuclease family protein [Aureispira sp.]